MLLENMQTAFWWPPRYFLDEREAFLDCHHRLFFRTVAKIHE
jgi:hypothetical protein